MELSVSDNSMVSRAVHSSSCPSVLFCTVIASKEKKLFLVPESESSHTALVSQPFFDEILS